MSCKRVLNIAYMLYREIPDQDHYLLVRELEELCRKLEGGEHGNTLPRDG